MTPTRLTDIVRADDIRGLVPEQLDSRVATTLGSAFAQVVVIPEGEDGMVIGHDMRDSSPELARAFAAGVAAHGVDITMIGRCSTDVLRYASGAEKRAGAMITASHSPAGYNGIKLCRREARPVGQDSGLAEVRDLAQWLLDRGSLHDLPASERTGEITETDMLAGYAAYLHSLVDLAGIRPLRIVVDAGHGMAGLTVPVVLGMDGLPLTVEPLHFELDGTFPHHGTNPLEAESLRDLQAAVLAHGADLGLAFDGDADRCLVIDERGEPVRPGAVTALVTDRETARSTDAEPSRVADTGMLAAMHLLAALGEQDGPLSQLLASDDRYVASGELTLRVSDGTAASERVRQWAAAQGASEDRLEGQSMVHEDPYWSFSLRPSSTEPLLRLNVEAQDRAVMEQVRDRVLALVRQER